MIVGLGTVLAWDNIPALSGTGLYALVPGFVAAAIAVVIGSLLDSRERTTASEST